MNTQTIPSAASPARCCWPPPLVGAAARGVGSAPPTRRRPPRSADASRAPAGGRVSFTGTLDRTAVLLGSDGLARMELVIAAAPGRGARAARGARPTSSSSSTARAR